MRKNWLIIGGVVVVIGGAMAFLLLTNRSDSPQDASQASDLPAESTTPETTPQPAEQAPAAQPGTYTTYSAEALAKISGRKVLFFHAPWCPQCRELEKSIQEGTVPSGVTIFKTDYDTSTDLRQKYGVTLQTTLVEVGAGGDAVGKYVAYDDPTLQAVVKGLKL